MALVLIRQFESERLPESGLFKKCWTKPALIYQLMIGTGSVKPPAD
jgi:hypothetical protein